MDLTIPLVIFLLVLAFAVIAMLAIIAVLMIRLIRAFKLIHNEGIPGSPRIAFWGSIIYTVFPIDLLPDPIYIDDIGILAAAIYYIETKVNRFKGWQQEKRLPSLQPPPDDSDSVTRPASPPGTSTKPELSSRSVRSTPLAILAVLVPVAALIGGIAGILAIMDWLRGE